MSIRSVKFIENLALKAFARIESILDRNLLRKHKAYSATTLTKHCLGISGNLIKIKLIEKIF